MSYVRTPLSRSMKRGPCVNPDWKAKARIGRDLLIVVGHKPSDVGVDVPMFVTESASFESGQIFDLSYDQYLSLVIGKGLEIAAVNGTISISDFSFR